MAKKPAAKKSKSAPRKSKKPKSPSSAVRRYRGDPPPPLKGEGRGGGSKKAHHENVVQRVAEEIESRLLEGAEMATETSSAETNVALAALAAIEGPHDAKAKPEAKPAHARRKRTRPTAR
jgi:hypothetical protein